MPITFLDPLANPYKEIDVDYFDRKALEKQVRHDTAREDWSNMVQANAANAYIDPVARQKYIEQQQALFDETIKKNSGNLSKGYQDVLSSIEQAKLNPYHNLNQRHVTELANEQALSDQYGADALNFSNLGSKTLTDASGKWINPADLTANVIKADDYLTNFKQQIPSLAATIRGFQGKLSGDSGNDAYLASKLEQWETLSENEIYDLMKNPTVRAAFIANNPTTMLDYRTNVGGSGDYTKKGEGNIFQNDETFATWATGNLQSEIRDEYTQTYDFLGNTDYEYALKNTYDTKLADYNYRLENMYTETPTLPLALDKESVVGTTYDTIKTTIDNINNDITSLDTKEKIASDKFIDTAFKTITVPTVFGTSISPKYAKIKEDLISNKDITTFTNVDGTLNFDLLQSTTGINYSETEKANIKDIYNSAIDAKVMKNQLEDTKLAYNFDEINKDLSKQYLTDNKIDTDAKDKLLNTYGIDVSTEEGLNKFITEYEAGNISSYDMAIPENVIITGGTKGGSVTPTLSTDISNLYNKVMDYKNEKYTIPEDLKYQTFFLTNTDAKSAVNLFQTTLNNALKGETGVGYSTSALANFTTKDGDALSNLKVDNTNLSKYLADNPTATLTIVPPIASPFSSGGTATAIVKDKDGKTVANFEDLSFGKDNQAANDWASEVWVRGINQALQSTYDSDYAKSSLDIMLNNAGASKLTEENNKLISLAKNNKKGITTKVSTDTGEKEVNIKQTTYGNYILTIPSTGKEVNYNSWEDLIADKNIQIGKLVYANSKATDLLNYETESGDKLGLQK
jgi:hypothetical protein